MATFQKLEHSGTSGVLVTSSTMDSYRGTVECVSAIKKWSSELSDESSELPKLM